MKTIRLLTIGNSFAENALLFLEAIANSADRARVEVGRANLGGCSLEKHWNLAEYTAKHPDYKTYRHKTGPDGKPVELTLQEALVADRWDFVTLQQVSHKSWRSETFEPFLGKLHALVRERAPQATITLHQTWAYRADTPYLPENNLTQELMFEGIRASYALYGRQYGCPVLPSGEAVQHVRRTPGRTFVWPEPGYDYQHAEAPVLPRQEHSLAAGWYWAINNSPEGIPELRRDANHLNARGCFLIGCVWYERFSGFDARETAFVPTGIDAADAAFLRAAAHEVCGRYTAIGA